MKRTLLLPVFLFFTTQTAFSRIYPNPANDVLNLEFKNAAEGLFTFEIVNLQGQLLSKSVKTISAGNGNNMEFD